MDKGGSNQESSQSGQKRKKRPRMLGSNSNAMSPRRTKQPPTKKSLLSRLLPLVGCFQTFVLSYKSNTVSKYHEAAILSATVTKCTKVAPRTKPLKPPIFH